MPSPPADGWWLLDEAQWASGPELVAVVARAVAAGVRVVLTSHVDLRRCLRRAGLEPVTWRLRGLRDDAAVAELVRSRIHPEGFCLGPGAARRLRTIAAGNIEVILRLCYEIVEDRNPPGLVSPADVERAATRLRTDCPALLAWRRLERTHCPRPPR